MLGILPPIRQQGFTLIEVVAVMVVLSSLSAVAMPRMMNSIIRTHETAVTGAGGSFKSGLVVARMSYKLSGSSSEVDNILGFGDDSGNGLDTNASGWPVGTDNSNSLTSDVDCVSIWESLLAPINRPYADIPSSLPNGRIYIGRLSAVTATKCIFAYHKGGMTIEYDTATGKVEVFDDYDGGGGSFSVLLLLLLLLCNARRQVRNKLPA